MGMQPIFLFTRGRMFSAIILWHVSMRMLSAIILWNVSMRMFSAIILWNVSMRGDGRNHMRVWKAAILVILGVGGDRAWWFG